MDIKKLHLLLLFIEPVEKIKKIIIGTLTDIASKVKAEKITMTAIVIIGDVIKPKSYEYSKLYDKTFTHGFRKAKTK